LVRLRIWDAAKKNLVDTPSVGSFEIIVTGGSAIIQSLASFRLRECFFDVFARHDSVRLVGLIADALRASSTKAL
jgi:hypothetical protein